MTYRPCLNPIKRQLISMLKYKIKNTTYSINSMGIVTRLLINKVLTLLLPKLTCSSSMISNKIINNCNHYNHTYSPNSNPNPNKKDLQLHITILITVISLSPNCSIKKFNSSSKYSRKGLTYQLRSTFSQSVISHI